MNRPISSSAQPRRSEVPLDDWVGLGDLLDLTVDRLVTPVEGVHRAIAGRWIRFIMPNDSPIPAQADRAIAGIYGTIRGAGSLLAAVIPMGAREVSKRRELKRLWGPGAGRATRATANAIWGDELADRASSLATQLELRSGRGDPIPVDAASLQQAFPEASPSPVLLVHGWNETEAAWSLGGDTAPSLADVLEASGRTCLLVRYNTGRAVAASGEALAQLIETVIATWPNAVESIDIVGHSMGGLVARSAAMTASGRSMEWVSKLRNLVTLGTPHLGSPIEKGLAVATHALRIVPESKPIGDFLDLRSRGIKDLRYGNVLNDGWTESTQIRGSAPEGEDERIPESVTQHFATGVFTSDPAHPLGLVFGDLVVRPGSGTGRSRRRSVEATNLRVFGGQKHTAILREPEVHRQVQAWLA